MKGFPIFDDERVDTIFHVCKPVHKVPNDPMNHEGHEIQSTEIPLQTPQITGSGWLE